MAREAQVVIREATGLRGVRDEAQWASGMEQQVERGSEFRRCPLDAFLHLERHAPELGATPSVDASK